MTDEEWWGVINYFDASGKEWTSCTWGYELASREKEDITYRDEIEIFRYSKTRRLCYGLIWQQRISTCSPWGIEENIWNRTIVSHCKLSRKPVKWIRIWPSSACLAKCWRELAVVKVKKRKFYNWSTWATMERRRNAFPRGERMLIL